MGDVMTSGRVEEIDCADALEGREEEGMLELLEVAIKSVLAEQLFCFLRSLNDTRYPDHSMWMAGIKLLEKEF